LKVATFYFQLATGTKITLPEAQDFSFWGFFFKVWFTLGDVLDMQ
jgi:hypothetical protein